jgi:hypothetical protein
MYNAAFQASGYQGLGDLLLVVKAAGMLLPPTGIVLESICTGKFAVALQGTLC